MINAMQVRVGQRTLPTITHTGGHVDLADIQRIIVDDQGALRFSADELRHAIPFVVFAIDAPLADLSDDLVGLCVDVCNAAGVRSTTTAADARRLLVTHYDQHPLPADFMARLLSALDGNGISARNPAAAAQALLGRPDPGGVLGGVGPRPRHTVPGGALARLALLTAKPKP